MYFTLSLERKIDRRVRETTEGNGKGEIISQRVERTRHGEGTADENEAQLRSAQPAVV